MGHEAVWYSRPRTYGKGSRQWYEYLPWCLISISLQYRSYRSRAFTSCIPY